MKIIEKLKHNLTEKEVEKIGEIFSTNDSIYCDDAIKYCDKILLLYDEHSLTGYCMFHFMNENDIYLDQVALEKQYQNHGFSGQFYDYLKENYIGNLYAHVCIDNYQSMKSLCRRGFVPIKVEVDEDFYGIKNYTSLLLVKNR